jgi:dTDP-6-deoxy-L-talose 4-dehydrogenase (NAD+)
LKKVLLTGSTGFVGSKVLKALADQDVEIHLVVRKGKEDKIPSQSNITSVISAPDLFAEKVDWWSHHCRGVDVIIHAAWYAEPGKYLQSSLNADCLSGSIELCKGAAAAGVKRFVGIGTCFEYDMTQGILSINTPIKPISPYAAAKAALSIFLNQWLKSVDVEFCWCRLFYLYGDGEDPRRLVPYIRSQLIKGEFAELTSGDQIRDYLDVSIAGRLIAKIATSELTGNVNICSGQPVTVRQLAEKVANEVGRPDLLRFGARKENLVDPPYVLGVPNFNKSLLN